MVTIEEVNDALREVIDPELGLDFVELGLIYGVDIDAAGAIKVTYTLTTPGCPIGPQVEGQIQEFVSEIEGVSSVESELVFTPPVVPGPDERRREVRARLLTRPALDPSPEKNWAGPNHSDPPKRGTACRSVAQGGRTTNRPRLGGCLLELGLGEAPCMCLVNAVLPAKVRAQPRKLFGGRLRPCPGLPLRAVRCARLARMSAAGPLAGLPRERRQQRRRQPRGRLRRAAAAPLLRPAARRRQQLRQRRIDPLDDHVDVGKRVEVGEQAVLDPPVVGHDRHGEGVPAGQEGEGEQFLELLPRM